MHKFKCNISEPEVGRATADCNDRENMLAQREPWRPDVTMQTSDRDLWDRALSQWQMGEWENLAQLSRDTMENHPDRARLAALAAAGNFQLNNFDIVRKFVGLAQEWGCSPSFVSQLLIAGVMNTLGCAAAVNREDDRARQHFEQAIAIVTPNSETARLGKHRNIREISKLQLQESAISLLNQEISKVARAPIPPSFRVQQLETEIKRLKEQLPLERSLVDAELSEEQKQLLRCAATALVSLSRVDAIGIRIELGERTLIDWGCRGTHIDQEVEDVLRGSDRRDLEHHLNVVITYSNGTEKLISRETAPRCQMSAADEKTIAELSFVCSERYQKYIRNNHLRIVEDSAIIDDTVSKEASILDIGSVPPLFPSLLAQKGFSDVSVIDPDAIAFDEYLRSIGVRAINGDLLSDFQTDRVYDLVTLCEVIEHMTGDLRPPLETIASSVKQGGYFFITTPNLRSLSGLIGLNVCHSGMASKPFETVRRQFDRISEDGYPGHIREYTEKELVGLVESFGFSHVESYYQPDYHNPKDPLSKLMCALEKRFPKCGLFGKHLFKRKGVSCLQQQG